MREDYFSTTPGWEGNFLLIKKIEFEEPHFESELILDNLQKLQNSTYVENNWANEVKQNVEENFNRLPIQTVLTVIVLHFLLML